MIRFSRLPIRHQLIYLAILLTLPAIGVIIYSGLRERAEDYRKAQIESQRLVDNLTAELQNMADEAKQICRVFADLPEVHSRDTAKVRPIISNFLKENEQYLNIVFADANGTIWGATHSFRPHETVADRRYFKNVRETRQFSSGEYVVSRTTGKSTLHVAYPILDSRGDFEGAVIVGFNLDFLRSVLERGQLSKTANYIIADHQGIIISRGRELGRKIGEPIQPDDLKTMTSGPERNTYEFTRSDGERRIVTYRKLNLGDETAPYAYIRGGMAINDAMSAANRKMYTNIALLMPFVLVAFALAIFIGKRSIVNRVNQLQAASQQIINGNLNSRVGPQVEGGELGELGRAFDDMADALDDKIGKLVQTQRELRDKASLLEAEVTERTRTQEDLSAKQAQLEALNQTLEHRVEQAVDELRQKDQALIQQNRLAAMGEMIGNIAHQWRHPLHNIGLLVQILPGEIEELSQAELEERVGQIMNIIMQMSQTIDDFTNFFHHDKEKTRFCAHTAVVRAVEFNSASLDSKGIAVSVEGDREASVFGYSNEYLQVLLNVINNAKDALVQRAVTEPRISIRISRRDGHSVVTIADNGGGIDENILPKIFDPYFTTKGPTLGTGIGLYMSKMIIEQNMEGRLTVRNIPNGAEFSIEV